MRTSIFLTLVPLMALACASPRTKDASPPAVVDAGESVTVRSSPLNDKFLDPNVDVDRFVETFEGESREISVQAQAIVDALEIRPGTRIADVGAGTGLFLEPLLGATGRKGSLVAVEISPAFVEHLEGRIREGRYDNARVQRGSFDSTNLRANSIDLAFVCDTYHHFDQPEQMLASIGSALVAGGRLALVEFERIPGVSRDWILDHVRAGKEEFAAEITAAGFELEREIDLPGLVENYVLVFRRVE